MPPIGTCNQVSEQFVAAECSFALCRQEVSQWKYISVNVSGLFNFFAYEDSVYTHVLIAQAILILY